MQRPLGKTHVMCLSCDLGALPCDTFIQSDHTIKPGISFFGYQIRVGGHRAYASALPLANFSNPGSSPKASATIILCCTMEAPSTVCLLPAVLFCATCPLPGERRRKAQSSYSSCLLKIPMPLCPPFCCVLKG